ncbi:MAG: pyrroline-5-carboxylate reductase dimerization domain-containing protein [Bdellovibrionota bacterium]|nr:pyrroline-5-carboxylate reductase dimerization domain-containing protein [Bdellovibrionota bacterium]
MRIGVIGCGNMASAVVLGIHKSNPEVEFLTYTPSQVRAKNLAQKVKGAVVSSLHDFSKVDYLMIACKPQQFSSLVKELESVDLSDVTLVSIMAAVPAEKIAEALKNKRVIRLMPSMPMQVGEGISLLLASDEVLKEQMNVFSNCLVGSSMIYHCKTETEFNQLTVLTASGPAYVYYLAEIFEKQLLDWNVDKDAAKQLAIQLFKGSSLFMETSDLSLSDQIAQVTSKKGVTIEAIDLFRSSSIGQNIKTGVERAFKRSLEIEEAIESEIR